MIDTTGNIVFDYEVTGSAASSIATGSILNGDVDGWYTIIARTIGVTTDGNAILTFNGDGGTNYGRRWIDATNTTVSDVANTGLTGIYGASLKVGNTAFWVATVYAKSGAVRLMNSLRAFNVSGTTVTSIDANGDVWNNTADNLVSMQFTAAGDFIAVGTRIIILKGNALAVGTSPGNTGAWKRVGTSVLGSAASSVTFSGLTGNTAILYYLSNQVKCDSSAFGINTRPNNDSSSSDYGRQYITASNTTISAARNTTGQTGLTFGYCDVGNYSMGNMLMFAKSGFQRVSIMNSAQEINGTTVTYLSTHGATWTNTADEITSIVNAASAGNFASGSQFDLYALYV